MKKLRAWGIVASILIFIVIVALVACGYKIGEKYKDNRLTLKAVVKTFNAEGLALKEDKSKSPDKYVLNGVKPTIYRVAKSDDTLLIYIFESFGDKKEILSKTHKFKSTFTFGEIPYHAKNTLILFIPAKIPETEEEFISFSKTAKSISDIVFEKLNEGKERVYKGGSESWEGTLTLKYYEHRFEEGGVIRYDSYYEKTPALQYKKSDIENVGPLIFEYEAGSNGGSAEGFTLNNEGYAKLGSSSGTGAILSEDAEVRFTVKWGGKEEHFVLKAH